MDNIKTKCITESQITENGDVNLLVDDISKLRRLPADVLKRDVINKITDPDRYPLEEQPVDTSQATKHPVMELGGLSKSKGTPSERTDAVRTADFISLGGGDYTFSNGQGFKMCVICYGADKTILPAWNGSYAYAYVNDGATISLPSLTAYIKFYTSDTSDAGAVFTLSGKGDKEENTSKITAGFVKQYFVNGGYHLECTEMDPGLWQLELRAKNDEFAILAIKPPKERPHEATLALSLTGSSTKQFADLSCMRYDETAQGQVCLICQKRGASTPLPYFFIGFNDGTEAGRVQKFRVNPDAIPVQLTNEGIKVRRNNHYDNDWTDADTVLVNLADLQDKVNKMYDALVADGTIAEGV